MQRDSRIRDWDQEPHYVPSQKPVSLDDAMSLCAKLAGIAFCCLVIVACICSAIEAIKITFGS